MANIEDKLPDNVDGRYFVDSECIDCDACRETAPQNFMRQQEVTSLTIVWFAHSEELCEQAAGSFIEIWGKIRKK